MTLSLSTRRTVDYSKMNDAEKFYNGLIDCRTYLGDDKFDQIIAALKAEPVPFATFEMMMGMLAGIEGYPVKAMYWFALGFSSIQEEKASDDQ